MKKINKLLLDAVKTCIVTRHVEEDNYFKGLTLYKDYLDFLNVIINIFDVNIKRIKFSNLDGRLIIEMEGIIDYDKFVNDIGCVILHHLPTFGDDVVNSEIYRFKVIDYEAMCKYSKLKKRSLILKTVIDEN